MQAFGGKGGGFLWGGRATQQQRPGGLHGGHNGLNQPVATETDADRMADRVLACMAGVAEHYS